MPVDDIAPGDLEAFWTVKTVLEYVKQAENFV